MKNKKGFISISIIYSFFIIFLLIMLAMLASYTNKRFSHNSPTDSKCDPNDDVIECLCKKAAIEGDNYTITQNCCKFEGFGDYCPDDTPTPSPTPEECTDKPGLYTTNDDYGQSNYYSGNYNKNYAYYGGYIWRILRMNGDGQSIRLVYAGESENTTTRRRLKKNSKPYITIKNYYGTDEEISQTRYNFSFAADSLCSYSYNNYISFQNRSSDCEKLGVCPNNMTFTKFYDWLTSESMNYVMKRCLLDEKDTKKGQEKTENSIRGAVEFHNIGYMRNTVYTPRYDSIFDNQDDSEIKSYVDYWYEHNLSLPANASSKPLNNVIFCGDKNLETSIGSNIKTNFEKVLNGQYSLNHDFYFSGHARMLSGLSPSLECMPSGTLGNSKSSTEFRINNKQIGSDDYLETKVLNFSKYNVGREASLLYQRDIGNVTTEWKCTTYTTTVRTCSNGAIPLYDVFNRNYYCPSVCTSGVKAVGVDFNEHCYEKLKRIGEPISGTINESPETKTGLPCWYETTTDSSTEYYLAKGTGILNKFIHSITGINNANIATKISEYDKTIGNGQLKDPIGLISVDEAYFAGARTDRICPTAIDSVNSSNNDSAYGYWTMTLDSTNMSWINKGAKYFVVETTSEGSKINVKNDTIEHDEGYYMRPVINISKDIEKCMINRKGTADDPFIFGEGC